MNAFFRKKFEIPALAAILVIFTIIALLGSMFSNYVNAANPIVMIPGAAGIGDQGPNISTTWNLVYMDYANGDSQFRIWTCAHPEDNFYADWTVEGTYDGTLKNCMEHARALQP